MSTKQSIRFYKDREVRAIWNDELNKYLQRYVEEQEECYEDPICE